MRHALHVAVHLRRWHQLCLHRLPRAVNTESETASDSRDRTVSVRQPGRLVAQAIPTVPTQQSHHQARPMTPHLLSHLSDTV